MRTERRRTIRIAVLVLILLLGIGFAALKTTLKIDGIVNLSKTTWDVHFENVQITNGSVTANPAPTTNNTDTTEMSYTINFTKPGDFFEFTVDIVNDGTIDAMVELVSNNAYANASSTTPITLPTYLSSSTTYNDGVPIAQNQELLHGTSEKVKVRVEFKQDINVSDLPSDGDTTVVFKFKADYKQSDSNASPIRVDFETASWEEIISAYNNNPASLQQSMLNGTTKEIDVDLDNDPETPAVKRHLRIANLSTPAECSTQGFSQTSCGLIIEFTDIIAGHRMTPGSNAGSWRDSDMRAYLNNGIYADGTENRIDYTTSGVFTMLPADLRNKIVTTSVVTGHGPETNTNFTTQDKLFLLGVREIYEDVDGDPTSGVDFWDTAYNNTRQLDYYKAKGVTTNYPDCLPTVKANEVESLQWWTRTPSSSWNPVFIGVNTGGTATIAYSNRTDGVSPAFRLA